MHRAAVAKLVERSTRWFADKDVRTRGDWYIFLCMEDVARALGPEICKMRGLSAENSWASRAPGIPGSSSSMPTKPAARPRPESTARVVKRRAVTLGDLVAAGLLPDGATLETRVKGVVHVARLIDGMLELGGRGYGSLSAASTALRGVPSNGWVDWRFKGETLADLRQRLSPALA